MIAEVSTRGGIVDEIHKKLPQRRPRAHGRRGRAPGSRSLRCLRPGGPPAPPVGEDLGARTRVWPLSRPARAGSMDLPVPLSQVGRAAHDLGLAGLLGGNLFGRLALHPSVTEISDQARARQGRQRGLAALRHGQLALAARGRRRLGRRARRGGAPRATSPRRAPAGAWPRTCSSASSRSPGWRRPPQGVRFARQAPDGAVPLATATTRRRRRPRRSGARSAG